MAHRILVVDDEQHILQVLTLKLRNAGYDVITAVDGEEGLQRSQSDQPDLVITDFQMPYMTGLELVHAMASDPSTAAIPVIMLTARGYAIDEADLAIGNIRDVMSKPFSPRSILRQVETLLAERDSSEAA